MKRVERRVMVRIDQFGSMFGRGGGEDDRGSDDGSGGTQEFGRGDKKAGRFVGAGGWE